MSAAEVAAGLADSGWQVFPCNTNKAPATPNGFKNATADPAAVRELWRRHPAPLIGVATGIVNGFDVLDIDGPRHPEAEAWWSENRNRLPKTRIHRTRSGGLHVLFAHAPGLRCWTARPVPGVDGRGDGGYVVWWPAADELVLCDAELAKWPTWVLAAFAPSAPVTREPSSLPALREGGTRAERYATAALRHAADRVAFAPAGCRNNELNRQAFGLTRFIAAGILDPQTVADRMAAAAFCAGLDEGEITKTLTSALSAGGVE